jgi:hypothetical protein
MGFTDALIASSDASVLLVDRRHAPGGHWNDAYPFVRLHQPSAFYGVSSTHLGQDRIDDDGFYERATGAEICHYFQSVLNDTLLPSGQVEFLGMTSGADAGDGKVALTSRLTGAVREVTVRRKVVDARYLEASVPSTHTPGFAVDDGVRCIPVNGLVRSDEPVGGYVVLGASKTAMDACSWLLDHGVDADRITWVKPREPWFHDRGTLQPRAKVGTMLIAYAASVEAAATATSIPDLFARLEDCGALVRLDRSVEPTMYRGSILSPAECEQLRTIEHVVRAGHVRRLQTDRMVFDDAEVATPAAPLYVDCTAEGLARATARPIFEADRVTFQQVREGSPSFNAALIGYLEATRDDPVEQNRLAPPTPHQDVAADWIRIRHGGMVAQQAWDQTPDVSAWMEGCRLNIAAGMLDHADEPGVLDAMGQYFEHTAGAIENLARFRTELGDVAIPA